MRKHAFWAVLLTLAVSAIAYAELRASDLRFVHREFPEHYVKVNDLIRELHDRIEGRTYADQVVASTTAGTLTGCTLGVDANANDIQTSVATIIQHKGMRFAVPADAAMDISAEATCAGDVVLDGYAGSFWLFANTAGATDLEGTVAGTQEFASAVLALASYTPSAVTLPPGTDDVAIGCFSLVESGTAGNWTCGTDSITDETEVYYSFEGLPGIVTAGAVTADTAAATFTYAANVVRLGTGTLVTCTGKANVALSADTVANGYVGIWLFYVLADDSEAVVQLGSYASEALADAAVAAMTPNPLLPLVAIIEVKNVSGATFTGATTLLDATGITTTITATTAGVNGITASIPEDVP